MSRHQARQLLLLRERILELGRVVENAFERSIAALLTRDADLATAVVNDDKIVDRMEVELEEECLKTLALYQPMANDLRLVVSILKINNDLARVGDLARNIAKRAAYLSQHPVNELTEAVREMAAKSQAMLKRSLDALVETDSHLAHQVCLADEEVDGLNKQIHSLVRGRLEADRSNVEVWLKWNSVAKHIERVADMSTNIAEDVIYLVEGNIVRHRAD